MTDYATQAELEAVEGRVRECEDTLRDIKNAFRRFAEQTECARNYADPMAPLRLDKSRFGYQPEYVAGPCLQCGEPDSEHGCPEVK
jgi:hypothetical protein